MKIAFGVTAYDKDVHLVGRCLKTIREQTRKPDRVFVAISGLPNIHNLTNDNLIMIPTRVSAGSARNHLISICREEVLCFCDADDEIHPQKCEIIHKIFTEHNPDLVLHGYRNGFNKFDIIDLSTIKTYPIVKAAKSGANLVCPINSPIAHGPASINVSRIREFELSYLDKSHGEDGLFCRSVLTNITNPNILYCSENLINYIKSYHR